MLIAPLFLALMDSNSVPVFPLRSQSLLSDESLALSFSSQRTLFHIVIFITTHIIISVSIWKKLLMHFFHYKYKNEDALR